MKLREEISSIFRTKKQKALSKWTMVLRQVHYYLIFLPELISIKLNERTKPRIIQERKPKRRANIIRTLERKLQIKIKMIFKNER